VKTRKPYVQYRGASDRKPFEYPEERLRFRKENPQLFADEPESGEYAWKHLRFLKDNWPDVLRMLRRSGDLNRKICSVGRQASEMFMQLLMQYADSPQVQKLPHREREQTLQSCRNETEEPVLHDVIFQPLRNQEAH
jgi:hypothetical protein